MTMTGTQSMPSRRLLARLSFSPLIIGLGLSLLAASSATAQVMPSTPSSTSEIPLAKAVPVSDENTGDTKVPALAPYAAIGCGACDLGTFCVSMTGSACNGMTNAIAGGYAMEAAMGGAMFGALGTLAGVVVGTGLGALVGVGSVFLGATSVGSPGSEDYIAGALIFGVGGAIVGGLLGLGFGVVSGIEAGPKIFRGAPPPPPPRAQKRPASTNPSVVSEQLDRFAY